jgi:phenylpropionate dioxygenase-like ring-hydroxylating dioxygenase large terminal subunit
VEKKREGGGWAALRIEKPSVGSWTEAYPELGTEPISYEDSISPEFFEAEREAIFKRCWLNVGRVEQLPKAGSYFTKELAVANTSIIVVRGSDQRIRAFHNICRHRGNKLVWTDYPDREDRGTCRQFACKYHGWRYALDGKLVFVQQEQEFFDLDKDKYGLVEVHLDVWEGFIFVNLSREPVEPLREFLGDMARGLEGYPFHKLTQAFRYRAEVKANWKLFMDAFQEFYHAPVLHKKQIPTPEMAQALYEAGYHGIWYQLFGPHRMISSTGRTRIPRDNEPVKPIDRLTRSGLQGPWDEPDLGLGELPSGINPARSPLWGLDSFQFFPNFVILIWKPSWYLTYHYWPLSADTHLFEGVLYFAPPKNAAERLAQETAAVTFKEFALQDGNTLQATQSMIKSRVVDTFPLCDEEILCRHLHKVTQDWVSAYQARG